MKIVINRCFGGFGLSDKAMRRYAELKGKKLYLEQDKRFEYIKTYWTVPESERPKPIENWAKASMKARVAYNQAHNSMTIYDHDIARDDPALVQTVEELGQESSGMCAALAVVEVPDDVDWEISEYDGREHIAQKHATWS